MFAHALLAAALTASRPALMAAYRIRGDVLYVGTDAEPPDHPSLEYYDSKTRRLGTLEHLGGDRYRTANSPAAVYTLRAPMCPVLEKRFVTGTAATRFGGSLWYARGAQRRPTIALIQGADDSTRDMGFLIPFFVSHGLNVITYDQRGTGVSVGNWRYTSPQSKAADIVGLLKAVQSDPAIDPNRIGAWAASNGGWVAPIVAHEFPLHFLILKSAPAGTIVQNVEYEIQEALMENGKFTPQQIAQAMQFDRLMLSALQDDSKWPAAGTAMAAAQNEPWFQYMRIPPGLTIPPPAPVLAGLRASLIYDPTAMLDQLRVPTLAIYGALDKDVDANDSIERLRAAFRRSGERDLTIVTFPGTGHFLVASPSGYGDQPALPVRYTGYPEAMIRWLDAHDR